MVGEPQGTPVIIMAQRLINPEVDWPVDGDCVCKRPLQEKEYILTAVAASGFEAFFGPGAIKSFY